MPVYYDPYDVGIVADPYPTYAALRDEAPIYYNERYDFWALSRHADVDRALSDWETFSNSRSDILELVQSEFDMPKGVMMFEDPPIHTMLRGLMSRVFTPRRMAEIEDQIRRFCINCLDPHVGSDGFDIITELAAMMPMRVIGMLLGIPESEQTSVRDANDANLRTRPGTPMKVAKADKIADGRIYADYVEWRSHNPSDDLMTALLNVEFTDEHGVTRKLNRKEVLHYTQVVAGAGNETTGRLIGWLAKVLAEHPDQRSSGRPGPVPTHPGHRRDPAIRTDRTACGPLHGKGFRVLRHYGAGRWRDAAAVRCRQPRPAPLRRPRLVRHPPRQRLPPHLRQGPALLPGREPGANRGPGGSRRTAQPLARMGNRLRQYATRADIDGPRLGAPAHHHLTADRGYQPMSRAAPRPAARPEKMHPPTKVPSRDR